MADGRFGCEADMAGRAARLDPVARDPSRKRSVLRSIRDQPCLSLRAKSIRTGVTPTRLRANLLALRLRLQLFSTT